MQNFSRFAILLGTAFLLNAQSKPEPDVIVFTNGDKLVGHFVQATSSTVTFKSDALGDLTIDWKKVKELRTATKVAVLRKGVKINKHESADVPQGTMAVENQTIQLTPAKSIPVSDTAVVVDEPTFQNAVTRHPGFTRDWKGAITLGASLVQATQDSRT